MNKFVAFLAVLGLVGAARVPNFFDKCKKNDPNINDCLIKNANKGWPNFVKGYNLQKIPLNEAPVEFPNILKGYVHSGHITGFDNIEFNKVKIDFNKKTLEAIYTQPLLVIHADNFEIFVDFLGANLEETGSGNGTFTDNIFRYTFDYDIVERDGEEYMKLKNPRMSYNTNHLKFDLISTVNKQRGVQLKNLFNNFWRVFNLLGEVPLAKFISDGVQPILEKYLSTIPMKSLFI